MGQGESDPGTSLFLVVRTSEMTDSGYPPWMALPSLGNRGGIVQGGWEAWGGMGGEEGEGPGIDM